MTDHRKIIYSFSCGVLSVLKRVAILMDVHSCKPKSMTTTSAKTPNIRGTHMSSRNPERKNRDDEEGCARILPENTR
jgi:hypothetical protein